MTLDVGRQKKSYEDFLLDQKTPDQLAQMANKIDERLFHLHDVKTDKFEFVAIGEFEEAAQALVNNWGKLQGIATGINAVDSNCRGLVGGELIILAGETSNGKTALGVNIAANVARQGHPVLFISLEITHTQLAARFQKVLQPGETLAQLPILMQKQDEVNWRDIDELIRRAKEEGAALVVIDHLHYFTREVDKIAEDLGRITKEFKKNAIRHDIPIILISHVRKRENSSKRAEMSNDSLRGSSLIAQDADIVMFVHRSSPERAIVKVTKNRNRGYDPDRDTMELEFLNGAIMRDAPFIDPFLDLKT